MVGEVDGAPFALVARVTGVSTGISLGRKCTVGFIPLPHGHKAVLRPLELEVAWWATAPSFFALGVFLLQTM